jgi:hypothetical protein
MYRRVVEKDWFKMVLTLTGCVPPYSLQADPCKTPKAQRIHFPEIFPIYSKAPQASG